MDNNISDLLNKVLSNPEMLEKVTTMLPLVTNLMGSGNEKKTTDAETEAESESEVKTETFTLPDKNTDETANINTNTSNNKNENRSEHNAESSASAHIPLSAEKLIANENVMKAFGNLIAALNAAQNSQPDTVQAFSMQNPSSPTLNPNSNRNDSASASALGNVLGNLLSNASNTSSNTSPSTYQTNTGEKSLSESATGNNAEKALDALKQFSSATSPEKDERVKLLLALKPFLKDHRRGKVDTAIKYMNAAKILNLFGKNGFV